MATESPTNGGKRTCGSTGASGTYEAPTSPKAPVSPLRSTSTVTPTSLVNPVLAEPPAGCGAGGANRGRGAASQGAEGTRGPVGAGGRVLTSHCPLSQPPFAAQIQLVKSQEQRQVNPSNGQDSNVQKESQHKKTSSSILYQRTDGSEGNQWPEMTGHSQTIQMYLPRWARSLHQ